MVTEEKKDDDVDDSWAVVISAGGKYLASVGKKSNVIAEWRASGMLELHEAYEFVCLNMMQQTPNGPALGREIRALPLGLNSYQATVVTRPTDIWFLSDMHTRDQNGYKNLVRSARAIETQKRAQDAGLVTTNQMPDAPTGRGFMGG